jgi:hypothetical protein
MFVMGIVTLIKTVTPKAQTFCKWIEDHAASFA